MEDNEELNQIIEEDEEMPDMTYDSGAPPIVVVVQGGKQVSF